MNIDDLSSTGFFDADWDARRDQIEERTAGKRLLVVGGAGSIGSSTIRELVAFRPDTLHVVDLNENSLVELVRDYRSGPHTGNVRDFRSLPLDFGSGIMGQFLDQEPPYDLVLNFAALKHVRSEKDVWSILRMLETNVLKTRLLTRGDHRLFSVSTDKAADPVNIMGASKRIMEHVIFSDPPAGGSTSARFANVAFSAGSLLEGFRFRLEKNQPLALPKETKRYFLSLRESGRFCVLAGMCAPKDHVLVPRMDPERDPVDLQSVAEALLHKRGLKPRIYDREEEARAGLEADLRRGEYPLLLTQRDTSGEKPLEIFVGRDETAVDLGMKAALGVKPPPVSAAALETFLGRVSSALEGEGEVPSKEELVHWMAELVPGMAHRETGRNLDERM
jgi:FlaA1/EpsC-like NDP-sugar epimerase